MKRKILNLCAFLAVSSLTVLSVQGQTGQNPVVYADVPDMSIIRVGNSYYMSSTTMHLSPGLPIMKSNDLVNWKLVSYAYNVLDSIDELNLENGKSTYGHGSWASSLRYNKGTYYVSTFANPPGKTYIYTTKDIEKGPWKRTAFRPALHDHSLFFDDDGRVYMLYGSGKLSLAELSGDLSGLKPGTTGQVIINNASEPAGSNIGLPSEGSQLFKINGKYFIFNITWPKGGMRTVIVHRADKITGPYEGRVALQDKGVAQGGVINTPKGDWYAYLFRDFCAVGRIPYLVPVNWKDGWPIFGVKDTVPMNLPTLPPSRGYIPGIVASDEFNRKTNDAKLPLVWQWNHNPDGEHWSLTDRSGFLRITTGRIDTSILFARNTLTQRTFGPQCNGITAIDVSHMEDGDCAGLMLLQKQFGWIGVKAGANGVRSIVMVNAASGTEQEEQSMPLHLNHSMLYLKADCDFKNRTDKAFFYYSLDGKTWIPFGSVLHMSYTIPHFMGYRFALFNYASKSQGGYVDFDFFRINSGITKKE